MKTYIIKYKGRGAIRVPLTEAQAQSLFDLIKVLEFEYIKQAQGSKKEKGRWYSTENDADFNS